MKFKARIKKTGEVVEVADYGKRFCPRYWTKTTGYFKKELEFIK